MSKMKFVQIIIIFFLGLIMFGCNLPENKKTTKKHLEILEQYYTINKTTLESNANNKGRLSPIGDAVAIFPATVATFLI